MRSVVQRRRPHLSDRALIILRLVRWSGTFGWRAVIVRPDLSSLLGSCRGCGLVFLGLGVDCLGIISTVSAEFRRIVDTICFLDRAERRALTRLLADS